jgi:hypothetical protein
MGRGIVDPVDDVRVSNPPVNIDLYDRLAEKLVENKYDYRKLAREILLSNSYQRAAARPGEPADERNFSHATVRRIPATVLLDCISQVTEAPEKFRGLPLGSRAVHIMDPAPENYFLTTFGRSARATACTCETRSEPTLSQALHLLNGGTVHGKITQGGVISRLLADGNSASQIIDDLYLRCLSRPPSDDERAKLIAEVEASESVEAGLQDIFWALLNSPEFLFLH